MKTFSKYRWEIGFAAAGLVLIHAFLIVPRAFRGNELDAENASQFGQFIGGYAGSIVGVVTLVVLVSTLRRQVRQFRDEGFEKRFFQLLDYHRENVTEIGVGHRAGRRTFVTLIREFRSTHDIINQACTALNVVLSRIDAMGLAYMAFYYGTGPNSTRVLTASLPTQNAQLVAEVIRLLNDDAHRQEVKKQKKLAYTPFEGHQSRLGHYFRHLYQMVCYVDDHAGQRAGEFAGLLRAQLSNHEQALLFLNSLSVVGRAWKDRGLIVRHDLIKNVPKDFFDPATEVDPETIYPDVNYEYRANVAAGEREPNRDLV